MAGFFAFLLLLFGPTPESAGPWHPGDLPVVGPGGGGGPDDGCDPAAFNDHPCP